MYKQIGYFSKTQGLKGHLNLHVTDDFDIERCEVLMVDLSGGQAPQFIQEFRESKNGFIVLLDEIDTVEKAKLFVGKKVLVDEGLIFESDIPDLTGYILIDKNFGEVGRVEGVEDTGTNLLISIRREEKEILLPFNEDMVERIDELKKQIFYKAPEGLIEMYL